MSDTKKALGRKSRAIGKENRANIYILLTKKPLTFEELVKESGLSRGTVSSHLKSMKHDETIIKTIEDDHTVYKPNLESEKVIAELKTGLAVSLIESVSSILPSFGKNFDKLIEDLAKDVVKYGKEEAMKRLAERDDKRELQKIELVESSEEEN